MSGKHPLETSPVGAAEVNSLEIEQDGAVSGAHAPKLWHLENGAGGTHIFDAWLQSRGGGVRVGVVDEGVNYRHVDLAGAYDTDNDSDVRDPIMAMDAMPDWSGQRHGTHVAGIIAGQVDGERDTAGAAPDANLTGIFLRYGSDFRFDELAAIISEQKNVDVANNSWSFTGAFTDNFADEAYKPIEAALTGVAAEGRGGLGTSIVFAAGNSRVEGDDTNFHSLTASRYTIAVGAHDAEGNIAAFSNPGATVLLTAPGVALKTTNVTAKGASESEFVSGTSFAAPMVTSTIALMLSENSELGLRDIQKILAISSTSRLDGSAAANGAGFVNGGGLMFSREGGFGKLDAEAAVNLARHWAAQSTLANEKALSVSLAQNVAADGSFAAFEGAFAAPGSDRFSVEHVELSVDLHDEALRDLAITLISPDGTRTDIVESMQYVGSSTSLKFSFGSVANWGEMAGGTWRVEFAHASPSSSFDLADVKLKVYGSEDAADDTYYITPSFAGLVQQDAGRAIIRDTDGGVNTVNFAAARSGAAVDLVGNAAGMHAGVAMHFAGSFQNLVGSTHDDVFKGNSATNLLVGDAGDDVLAGRAGNDTLSGGKGDDRLDGGAGADQIDGGEGFDTAFFAGPASDFKVRHDGNALVVTAKDGSSDILRNVEALAFGQSTQTIVSTRSIEVSGKSARISLSGNDKLSGGVGADKLDGGKGADAMAGGAGNDLYVVDNKGDKVIEERGGGVDTVKASVSFSLKGQAVEKLILTGGGDLSGIGNGLDNEITGSQGANRLLGLEGKDRLFGGAGSDLLDGGKGADTMAGGSGGDRYIVDNKGDKVIEGRSGGFDSVFASVSFDLGAQRVEKLVLTGTHAIAATGNGWSNDIVGNAAGNRIAGMGGDDRLLGNAGNDVLDGGSGADRMDGGDGNDRLLGGAGNDSLKGGAGNDRLSGGAGSDILFGGAGHDVFIFDAAIKAGPAGGVDRIVDFKAADDTLVLDGSVFAELRDGMLQAAAFKDLAKGERDANDRIIYDRAHGDIYFDRDGSGTKHQMVKFAHLDSYAVLSAQDFFVG